MGRLLAALVPALFPVLVAPQPAMSVGCAGGSPPAILHLVEGGGWGCQITPAIPQFFQVAVVAAVVPVAKIRFSLPDPPFGTVVGEQYHYPYSGNRVTGMEMNLGGCSGAETLVLATLTIIIPGGTFGGCQEWRVDDGCEAVDCTGVTRTAYAMHQGFSDPGPACEVCLNYFQECVALPPYDLGPPCGDGNVPVDVELSWSGSPPVNGWFLKIGTDPTLATAQSFYVGDNVFSPDFLLPGTTYYWSVAYDLTGEACAGGASPVYSFTTAGPTPAEPTTWGRIKALYR